MSLTRSTILAAVAALLTPDGAGNILLAQSPPALDNSLKLATTASVIANGLRSAGFTPIAASQALTAANLGQTIGLYSTVAGQVLLPTLAASPAGTRLEFFNYNTGPWTVAVASGSGNEIFVGSGEVTSLLLYGGDSLTLESEGPAGYWFAVGGTAQHRYAGSMQASSLLAASGYRWLPAYPQDPEPLLFQWTTSGLVSAGGSGTANFPISFPNACLWGVAAPVSNAGNNNAGNVSAGGTTTSAISLYNWGPISASARIFAIGC